MSSAFRTVRGMKDLYDLDIIKYNYLIERSIKVAMQHGYKIMETPILEYTEVFQRSIGDETDVVSKEMYTFLDRGDESVTLRPEGTAGIIRAIVTNNITQSLPIKLMYYGPMFRYDRPQKGRYRQFHQIGFENIGDKTPHVDALTILLASDILYAVGIFEFKMAINTLGDEESKSSYTKAVVKYFSRHEQKLSEDSKRRLKTNPLRILDSKEAEDIEVCSMAPIMGDYLNKESEAYFSKVCQILEEHGVPYEVDNFLVRGLDYYTHTAFEIKTSAKNVGSVGGGGRYDNLVKMFGGPDVSGVGFAFGAERVMSLINDNAVLQKTTRFAVVSVSDSENDIAFKIMRTLHNCSILCEFIASGNIGKKMKIADRLGCDIVFIIGEREKKDKTITVKFMRITDEKDKSTTINMEEVTRFAKFHEEKTVT
ncbi:MAG: histidine--tRNA ligase [Holosporales bacterium]|jgi:histidyl-tRNA synthetase|nr:histidine--tRNA ligase [Holosporales bacterium]